MSTFESVTAAPPDPILGMTEAFVADPRPDKINLGVGAYLGPDGKVPLLECVRTAAAELAETGKPYSYQPIAGLGSYCTATAKLIFGAEDRERVAVVQTLGGTGALRVAADFLYQLFGSTTVLVSDPTWENHPALFAQAGFSVKTYPYYDSANRSIDTAALLAALRAAEPNTIVILHSCCHNPTGYDLTNAAWDQVLATIAERQLVPVIDLAYQGFAESLTADVYPVRQLMKLGLTGFVTSSFSKTFSLYGERVGALSVICGSADEAAAVLSQLKILIRTNYSNPPSHGAEIVSRVLNDPGRRAQWEAELGAMRQRIQQTRQQLRSALTAAGVTTDLEYLMTQRGMFSYSGLTRTQMQRLRTDFGVYGLDSGRLCVAAINEGNLAPVTTAIAAVMTE